MAKRRSVSTDVGNATRRRLLDAMVQTVARYGYGGLSVARVIEQAGVSRATYYKYFADKGDCFLASHREIASKIRTSISAAFDSAASADRPRAVVEELLRAIATDPAGARLVLIEALGADPGLRTEHDALIENIDRSIERFLCDRSATTFQIPSAAILGGIGSPLSTRVFNGAAATVENLLDDLLLWLNSYALPAGQRRWSQSCWEEVGRGIAPPAESESAPQRALPRGRAALRPSQAAHERRTRILAATARLTRRRGYAGFTVTDITIDARITRAAFYSHFHGKQDAFLAAQTLGLQESIAAAASDFFVASTWPERVWNGLRAMFGYLADNPDLAYLGVVEVNAAGGTAIRSGNDYQMAYALFLEDGYRLREGVEPLPRLCSESVAGAILALIRRQILRGRGTAMLEVLPQAAHVALSPFIGVQSAAEFVEAKARSARRGSGRGPGASVSSLARG